LICNLKFTSRLARQALVFAGSMTFNPATDTIPDKDGKPFKFKAPYGNQPNPLNANHAQNSKYLVVTCCAGDELPKLGFDAGKNTYSAPPADRSKCRVDVSPTSTRLQVPRFSDDFRDLFLPRLWPIPRC
jgi:aconitate hydratase